MTLKFEDIFIDKEFEELLPELTIDEFESLEKNIVKNGVLDPLKIWNDPETNKWVLIDGHNRYKIIKKNNIEFNIWHGFKIMYEEELPTREDVKEWMLEQQLGRRNLTEMDRYEIVQKFKDIIANKAKQNQSLGGKGLQHIAKVNTRKELATKVGVSEETYRKLDKIAQSANENLKQKLKDKKISVSKAYKEVQEPKQKTPITPIGKIEQIDKRMNEIDKGISSLRTEREALMRKRSRLFSESKIECKLKYEFVDNDNLGISRDCVFYIEFEGNKDVLANVSVYLSESPLGDWQFIMSKIPEKYKNDFIMLWKKAHDEEVEYCNRKFAEFESRKSVSMDLKVDKEFYKKCFRVLVKSFHPDNGEENIEDMQLLNQLKQTWGV